MRPGDRLAQRGAAGRGHVVGIATAKLRDGALDDGRGRLEIGIADAQDQHVLAALARGDCLVVREPRVGAVTADPMHQRRVIHVLTVRGRC